MGRCSLQVQRRGAHLRLHAAAALRCARHAGPRGALEVGGEGAQAAQQRVCWRVVATWDSQLLARPVVVRRPQPELKLIRLHASKQTWSEAL